MLALMSPASAHAGTDFNGDGRQDLAAAAAGQSLNGELGNSEGLVNIVYGRRDRLRLRGNRVVHQDSRGIREHAERGDVLGVGQGGDFNGDGRDDLVLSAPAEDLEPGSHQGAVGVVYGTRNGVGRRDQLFTQDSPGIRDRAENGDRFGLATAAGDFDGDGRDDLAIGVGEDLYSGPGARDGAGAVHIIYGGRRRLRSRQSQYFTRDKRGMNGPRSEELGFFGRALESGDFNGDGRDDLAVAAREEFAQGSVQVLYGSRRGLSTRGDQRLSQTKLGPPGEEPEAYDSFGSTLASGDFDRDGQADLAIGALGEDYDDSDGIGAVHIVYGSRLGLPTSGGEFITPDDLLRDSDGDPQSLLGGALAAGDLDKDGRDDLAIGADLTDNREDSGAVHVLFARRGGINLAGNQLLNQQTPGLEGDGEQPGDGFGTALAIANLNGRGAEELVLGEPQYRNEVLERPCREGAVHVLYPNKRRNLTKRGTQFIEQATPGLRGGGRETCDLFGELLGAG